MTMNSIRKPALACIALLISASSAFAKVHQPQVLASVLEQVEQNVHEGGRPVVLFDLDDTLINTRERNKRIMTDFVQQRAIQRAYPNEARKIANLKFADIKYLLTDTLKNIGVVDAALVTAATDFWLARFFTNEYTAEDLAIAGATKYLRRLAHAGAHIVYLTGRDAPRMREGTIANLQWHNFPLEPSVATLMLKPDAKIDDLAFKKTAFAEVAIKGEVVALFENEPANLNAMMEAFPAAEAIFLDTAHSPKPDVPAVNAEWVSDFEL